MEESYTTRVITFQIAKDAIIKSPMHLVYAIPMVLFWLIGLLAIVEGSFQFNPYAFTSLMLLAAVSICLYTMSKLKRSAIVVTEKGMIQVNYCGMKWLFENGSIQRRSKYWDIGNVDDSFFSKVQIPYRAFPDLERASVYVVVRN